MCAMNDIKNCLMDLWGKAINGNFDNTSNEWVWNSLISWDNRTKHKATYEECFECFQNIFAKERICAKVNWIMELKINFQRPCLESASFFSINKRIINLLISCKLISQLRNK